MISLRPKKKKILNHFLPFPLILVSNLLNMQLFALLTWIISITFGLSFANFVVIVFKERHSISQYCFQITTRHFNPGYRNSFILSRPFSYTMLLSVNIEQIITTLITLFNFFDFFAFCCLLILLFFEILISALQAYISLILFCVYLNYALNLR